MSLFNTLVSKTIMHVPGPIVGYFAKGYIAGEKLADAVRVTKELNREGAMATIDILGEFITNLDEAAGFRDGCLEVLETIAQEGLDANLSLKPTQMGLQLDKEQAFANIRQIVAKAAELDNFVRIDMEDIPCTDDTLDFYRRLRKEFPGHVGVVLQAYLRRTPKDIDSLADAPMNFRLCKGIYNEPRRAAWKDMPVINDSFIYCLEKMLRHKAYVGIATHDTRLVFHGERLVRDFGLQRDQYEFQMLLGVDPELRSIILEQGHRLRVYVPFGASWMPYSRRRLKENPTIALHALRQMFGLR
jgi:proline dehydrogenase